LPLQPLNSEIGLPLLHPDAQFANQSGAFPTRLAFHILREMTEICGGPGDKQILRFAQHDNQKIKC
jgi:hypothetical protein